MDVSITDSGTIEVGRDHAIKYGVPGATDPVLAGFLLNLAERDGVITVTHGVIATLVEAAARIDGDTYLAWMKQREAFECRAVNEDDWLAAYEDRWEIDGDEEYDDGDDFDSDNLESNRPVSMLDLAIHRGVQADEYERIPASEFTRVGIATLGGCAGCQATIAVYNAYPSKSGFWKCGDCIGDSGWDNIVEADNQIFDEAEGEE